MEQTARSILRRSTTHFLIGRRQAAYLGRERTLIGLPVLILDMEDALISATCMFPKDEPLPVTDAGVTLQMAMKAVASHHPSLTEEEQLHLAHLVLCGKSTIPKYPKEELRVFAKTLKRLGFDAHSLVYAILAANRKAHDAKRYRGPSLEQPDAPYCVTPTPKP